MRGDDDHRPRDEISLGGRPGDGPTLLDRLVEALRRRLGAAFGPVVTGAVVVLVLVGATAVFLSESEDRDPRPPQAPSSTSPPDTGDAVSSPPMPVGRPPTMPYYAGGALVWPHGSLTIDREHIASMVSRDGASLVRMWDQQEVLLVDGPELTPLAGRVFNGPAVDPGGELAAWIAVEQAATGSALVLWDLERDRQVARQHLRLPFPCCDHPGVQIVGIDGDGQVYLTATGPGERYIVWDPERLTIRQIRGTRQYDSMLTVTASGPVFTDLSPFDRQARSVVGVVDAHFRFAPSGTVHSTSGVWSRRGDVVAHLVSKTAAVVHPIDGLALLLQTPSGWAIRDLAWESDSKLLVVVTGPDEQSWWLRCGSATGQCVIAADLGGPTGHSVSWQVSENVPARSL